MVEESSAGVVAIFGALVEKLNRIGLATDHAQQPGGAFRTLGREFLQKPALLGGFRLQQMVVLALEFLETLHAVSHFGCVHKKWVNRQRFLARREARQLAEPGQSVVGLVFGKGRVAEGLSAKGAEG